MIVNEFKPWLSSADIDKGARWSTDVAGRLQSAKAGIICITPSNLHSDWVLFEAGALSKTLENTFVCPLLVGIEPTEVKGPLAQFQATRVMKPEILKLLKTLNKPLGEKALTDAHIESAFEVWWPKLESDLKGLPTDDTAASPQRSERDLLEEILSLVRNQSRQPAPPPPPLEESAGVDALRSIVGEIFRAANEYDPAPYTLGVMRETPDLEFRLRRQGPREDECEIVLPRDIPADRVAPLVRHQLRKHAIQKDLASTPQRKESPEEP